MAHSGISDAVMANVLNVQAQESIVQLTAAGWPIRRISRHLGLDRKTIRRYLRQSSDPAGPSQDPKSPTILTPGDDGSPQPKSPTISTAGSLVSSTQSPATLATGLPEALPVDPRPAPPAVADPGRPGHCSPHAALITAKLETGLSAQRIHQDLVVEVGFTGSYQSVKRFVRRLRGAVPDRVWRIEVQPGEEAQVDFGTGAWVIDPISGVRRRPWVLRVVLSFSRKGYSEAFFRQDTEQFIRGLENAWRAFGGVPRTLNLDNLKAAVLQADWFDPGLNPKLASFAKHYGCTILPCRPRTPEHKGKVENGIAYVKDNALRGRSFPSLAAQNQHLDQWERSVADRRIHGTTRQQVAARFTTEQPALLPLPPNLFPVFSEAKRSVHRDSYIEVKSALYLVPPEYIRQTVWARWDSREVRIFNMRFEQIAIHPRLEPGRFTSCLGLGGGHGPIERQLAHWQSRAEALGTPAGQWARRVVSAKGPIGLRSIMGLISLAEIHPFRAINSACDQAMAHGTVRLRDIRKLLEAPPSGQMALPFQTEHPLYRNLAEYGHFIENHA
jgi:transposase